MRSITRLVLLGFLPATAMGQSPFEVVETTVAEIHSAYASGSLTARELVGRYLDRIDAYDQNGPSINAVITLNADALEEADRLDAALRTSGFVGPLHGIPVMLKDQIDVAGMPTTLGSILFRDYFPDRDAFVTEKLKEAGAIILAKVTLGELAAGDAHGSLFGSTRNPYALDRTVGGSSGGSAATVAANFATVAVGQEALASIRRPAAWNSIVGMRPTAGLVSRGGVFAGWPQVTGSLGPMARTVEDLAALLDVLVGYDPEDPITARGVAHMGVSFQDFLDEDGLTGARLGVLRESIGIASEPDSEDFAKVDTVFERSIAELKTAGAVVVDPIVIPNINELLSKRASSPTGSGEAFAEYFSRSRSRPFASVAEMVGSPEFDGITNFAKALFDGGSADALRHYEYLVAREELMHNFLKVMADHELDAIVYKAVEHQPTLIEDGVNPPFVNTKGVPFLNAFLVYVPALVVPAGFTVDDLPVGITFMGRPYDDGAMLRLAYAYEQATHHRRPPDTTPPLN
ncbi:amidase [Candidatus Rariloculus sp.]|uniref:amidase n=1 Tax=Candidatus Rariloculus sp. TaxID=3101265 RepID=UPI003D09B8A2